MIFSQSKLNLAINDCFGKFQKRYLERIPVVQSQWPGTILGLALHNILEEAITRKKKDIPNKKIIKELQNSFEYYFDKEMEIIKASETKEFKRSRDYVNKKEFVKKGNKITKMFLKFVVEYFDNFDEAYSEIELECDWEFLKDTEIKVIIDLLLVKDDKVYIIDFKTTKKPHKFYYVHWDDDLQSKLYTYAVSKKFDKKIKYFSYVIFNTETKIVFFNQRFSKKKNEEYLQPEFYDSVNNKFKKVYEFIDFYEKNKKNENELSKWYNPEDTKCFFCEYKNNCIYGK